MFIFSTPVLIRHLWQLKTVVFLHRCLICAFLLKLLCLYIFYLTKCELYFAHSQLCRWHQSKQDKDTGFRQVRGMQLARWGVKNFFMLFVNDKIGTFAGITFGEKAVTLSEWSTVQCIVSLAVFTPIYYLGTAKWHFYFTLRLGRHAGTNTVAYWAQLWSLRWE